MSARRKALRSTATATLNFRVQGLTRQRHDRGATFPHDRIARPQPPGPAPQAPPGAPRSPLQQRLAARALYRQLAQHPLFAVPAISPCTCPTTARSTRVRCCVRRRSAARPPAGAGALAADAHGVPAGRQRRTLDPQPLPHQRTAGRRRPPAQGLRWTWYCCRWWGSTNRAGAWAWAAASTTAAWPTWRGAKWSQTDADRPGP